MHKFLVVVATVAALAMLTERSVDRGAGRSLSANRSDSIAEAMQVCARPSLGTEDAILGAAEGTMITKHREVFGYARLARVEGDWARVVVVPRTVTDNATLILRREDSGIWKVVWGPGTGAISIPEAPEAVSHPCP